MAYKNGIDISEHNPGIDYTNFARLLDFVILRTGYGSSSQDKLFMNHLNGFKAAGLPIIGVYHFIYAVNESQAKANAEKAIQIVQKAGLPKTTRIWCDLEDDTVTKARKQGVEIGPELCRKFTKIFCETIEAAGYPTGIYTNQSYYTDMYGKSWIQSCGYPIWLADLEGAVGFPCMIHQYSWNGRVYGSDTYDMDYLYDETDYNNAVGKSTKEEATGMTETDAINKVVSLAESEEGYVEKASNTSLDSKYANAGSGNYTKYNRDLHQLQPSNMDFPAPWCDAFVDWLFYKTFGASLARQMLCGDFDDYTVYSAQHYKDKGRWFASPKRGDQVFFRNSTGICHTGIVVKVSNNIVYCIEGNKSNRVARCQYTIGDSYIAGYGRPLYELAVTKTDNSGDELSGGNPIMCKKACNVYEKSTSKSKRLTGCKKGQTVNYIKKTSSGKFTNVSVGTVIGWIYTSCLTALPVKGSCTGNSVNVRTAPTTSSTVVGTVDKNQAVNISGSKLCSDGYIWYYVARYATKGWMRGDYVKF